MFHSNLQPNMLLILLLFLSQQNQVQAGIPCNINYGPINEVVLSCQGSSWLPWDCGKCSSSQHTLTERLRLFCCPGNTPLARCLQECGLPSDADSETMKCGFVCEPFFNSTAIPPPTTTKSTTPATQRPTTNATTTTQSTTTTPYTETSTIIPTTPTTTTQNPSTTTKRSTTKPTTTVTTANTLKSSTPISTTDYIASTQATQHAVLSGNVRSISKEDKGSDQKWCVIGPWKLHSDPTNSLSICTIVLICVLLFLVTVLVGIIVGIVRFKKGQTSSDSTLVTVKPKDSVDMSVEIPSQENLQEKDEGTVKRSNIAASSVSDIASMRFIGKLPKSNSSNRLMDLQQNHCYSPLPSPKLNKKMADVEAVEDLNTPNNMNARGSICGDSNWYI